MGNPCVSYMRVPRPETCSSLRIPTSIQHDFFARKLLFCSPHVCSVLILYSCSVFFSHSVWQREKIGEREREKGREGRKKGRDETHQREGRGESGKLSYEWGSKPTIGVCPILTPSFIVPKFFENIIDHNHSYYLL